MMSLAKNRPAIRYGSAHTLARIKSISTQHVKNVVADGAR